MMKQTIIMLVSLLTLGATSTKAESADSYEEFEESKIRINVTGELNSADAWKLEAGCHWFPIPFVGVGGSLGYYRQFSTTDIARGDTWWTNEDSEKAQNLFLHPSAIFFSPYIFRKSDYAICLYGELGTLLTIPYDRIDIDINPNEVRIPETSKSISSSKGAWCFFDGKIGLSLRVNKGAITLGYSYSTLDVYAQRRTMKYDNQKFNKFYPKAKGTHGVFLSIQIGL